MSLQPTETIKIGTCAWSFDDWRGGFYPEHLPSSERLAFYAAHFSSVEVDATFYHVPTAAVVRHWAEVTPEHFVFSCKAPREITHERRLRDSTDLLEIFLRSLDPLRAKLGAVLLQLPPSFRRQTDEAALRAFLRALPRSVRFAVEFRHAGWHRPRIVHLLEEARVCWVWVDATPLEKQEQGAFAFQPETTDFTYVRLLGDLQTKYRADGENAQRYHELRWPRDASLENWAARLRQGAGSVLRTLAYVANHFEGFAPLSAQRLSALLGNPVPDFGPVGSEPKIGPDGQLPLL